MKCNIQGCIGEYEKKQVLHTLNSNGKIMVIDHVPAEVCKICGDILFDPETVRRIEKFVNIEAKPISTVPLYDFNKDPEKKAI